MCTCISYFFLIKRGGGYINVHRCIISNYHKMCFMVIFSIYRRLFNSVQQLRMIFPTLILSIFLISGNDSDISGMQLNSSVGPRAIFRVPVRKAYNAILLFYDSLVAFREQLCSFIRAIHIEPNVPPLHGWWVFLCQGHIFVLAAEK